MLNIFYFIILYYNFLKKGKCRIYLLFNIRYRDILLYLSIYFIRNQHLHRNTWLTYICMCKPPILLLDVGTKHCVFFYANNMFVKIPQNLTIVRQCCSVFCFYQPYYSVKIVYFEVSD